MSFLSSGYYNFFFCSALVLYVFLILFQDLTQLHFDYEKGSPEEILMNLAKGETTYAVVYDTLCRFVNIEIVPNNLDSFKTLKLCCKDIWLVIFVFLFLVTPVYIVKLLVAMQKVQSINQVWSSMENKVSTLGTQYLSMVPGVLLIAIGQLVDWWEKK